MLAASFAIFASIAIYLPSSNHAYSAPFALLLAMVVATIVYAVFAVLFKMITTDDILLLPWGEKLLLSWRAFHKEKRKGKNEI